MNRQKLILSVLLTVLALSIAYSIWKMPRQKSVSSLTFTTGTVAKTKKAAQPAFSNETRVRLDLLNRETGSFTGFRKNIFGSFIQEKKEKIPERRLKIAKPSPPPPPPAPVPEPPSVKIQREMAQFTFMGFLKKENRRTIFLSSSNEIFLVKKGDMIAGKYLVANITDEMLSIRSMENGLEVAIPLMENRPLAVPVQ